MITLRGLFIWSALVSGGLALALFLLFQNRQERLPLAAKLPAPCQSVSFEHADFIACTVDTANYRIALHLNDDAGQPWHNLQRFASAMHPVFAMNAGMYHEDLSPVGLYIENGLQVAALQAGSGIGNFFMKPNGIFGLLPNGSPFVLTTETYAQSKTPVAFASQSGPMLVINGEIHVRFEPDGASRYSRNGVGIDDRGRAVFVLSRQAVSFGKFARFFRDALKCKNALYFDGVISAFSDNDSIVQGGNFPLGPIVAVFDRQVD